MHSSLIDQAVTAFSQHREITIEKISSDDFVGIIAIVTVFATAILIVLASLAIGSYTKLRSKRIRSDLVNKLVDRGFTAEEISNILISSGIGVADPLCGSQGKMDRSKALLSVPPQKPIRNGIA
ncbi:MAG TPA: hypothetical protein PKD64_15240 [Pirellulaceae bacterium]|nr:hypothetical protein [Pirellulaceae bacterium]HMO93539.1 hypothetical protein [Pirellulaceae bacterium]HMP70349.1 hypothetical protein [Pirellulaceae bacterium]